MFGIRTPAKRNKTPEEDPQNETAMDKTECLIPKQAEEPNSLKSPAGASQAHDETFSVHTTPVPSVRKSIGEWETGKAATVSASHAPEAKLKAKTPPKKAMAPTTSKPKPKTGLAQDTKAGAQKGTPEEVESSPTMGKVKYIDRLSEAKACVTKAKLQLGSARNIKTEIKTEVTVAIDRLFQLVKEAESVKATGKKVTPKELERDPETPARSTENAELLKKLAEHALLIQENTQNMEKLKDSIEKHQKVQEGLTYASVAAATTSARRQIPEQMALHSVVITAKDETETGEDVLNRIRKAVNAREGGVVVERIRKAKDRKVIVGCKTEEERQIIKDRLKKAEGHLTVEEVKNKDPLVILRDVFLFNTDEDVLKALKIQNKSVLRGLDDTDIKMEIAYKKKTRNPHTNHIIMRVSPKVWQRLVDAGTVQVDLQRVRVLDQSPLVQCSLCLGYGHGKRFCKDKVEKCSHCGGPHMKTECADWLAGSAPSCCNCMHAKLDRTEHSAFDRDCPIRKKWEVLARATVAYC